jgi:hypothetical protein
MEEALTLIAAVEGGTIDPRAVDQGRVVAAQLRRQLQRAANLCQLAAAELENQDHLSKASQIHSTPSTTDRRLLMPESPALLSDHPVFGPRPT